MRQLMIRGLRHFDDARAAFGSLAGGTFAGLDSMQDIIRESCPEEGEIHPRRAAIFPDADGAWVGKPLARCVCVGTPGGVRIWLYEAGGYHTPHDTGLVVIDFGRNSRAAADDVLSSLHPEAVVDIGDWRWLAGVSPTYPDCREWSAADALSLHRSRCEWAEDFAARHGGEARGEEVVVRPPEPATVYGGYGRPGRKHTPAVVE